MMKQLLVLSLVLLLVLTAGCVTEAPQEASADTAITGEVDEVETLSDDLSTSELDSLDKDLAEVNW